MSRPVRIGIVGGGASAVCLLDAISQSDRLPESVTVFEPCPHLWRGRAYQPDLPTLRVNAPPDDMSVRFGDPHHFESWAEARRLVLGAERDYVDPYSGVQFMPRAMYGDYLEQSARAAIMRLGRAGCQVELVRDAVAAAERGPDTLTLRLARGGGAEVDTAVLCVGTGTPADPYGLTGAPGFIPDPYPVARRLAGIPAEQEVAVIGSGLTAVDIVLTLAASGHRGRISLLSRRGALPAVRQRPVEYQLRHFTPGRFRAMAARGENLTLDGAFDVMKAELADSGVRLAEVTREVTATGAERPVARLRRQLAAVDDPDLGLRILQRAVPDTGPDVWPLLPEQDKTRLLSDHYRTIMSLCCPMPPSSAAALLALVDSGQLELVPGVDGISARSGSGFRVTVNGTERTAHTVISAVSAPAHKIPGGAAPLIGSLADAGLAVRHPRGGVHVERATSRLLAGGAPDPMLYALGDLAAGSLFFTFGLPSLVDRAYDIAEAILGGADADAARRGGAMQAA